MKTQIKHAMGRGRNSLLITSLSLLTMSMGRKDLDVTGSIQGQHPLGLCPRALETWRAG